MRFESKMVAVPYPPYTLHQLLAGLHRQPGEILPSAPKFLNRSNSVYRNLHRACDTVYHELHGQGIGTNVKCTAKFTLEEEEKL